MEKRASAHGKGISKYAGNQSKKGVRAIANKAGAKDATRAMREGRFLGLQQIPGLRWATSRGASLAGRAIEPHTTNKDLVEAAKKKVPDSPAQIKENLSGNMNAEDTFAHLAKLIEKGELTGDTMVGKRNYKDFIDKSPAAVRNYNFEKSLKDGNKLLGSDFNMREAERELQAAPAGPEQAASIKKLDAATKDFIKTLEKSDMSKLGANTIFKDETSEAAKSLSRALIDVAPHLVSSMLPKMKTESPLPTQAGKTLSNHG